MARPVELEQTAALANPLTVDLAKLIKAIWWALGILTTIAIAIFGAGVYWASVTSDVRKYIEKIDKLDAAVNSLQSQNESLKKNLNSQFGRLVSIENKPSIDGNPSFYQND